MPDDINKRMHYFDRQFLRANDFQVEQQYHLNRLRSHNLKFHTSGLATANDLVVTGNAGATTVTVSPGTAIDELGREIVLLLPQTLNVISKPNTAFDVVISLEEAESDPSSDPGVIGNTRITETPTVAIVEKPNTVPRVRRLAEILLNSHGELSAPPDNSVRIIAGVTVSSSLSFENAIANTLTLKNATLDPDRRPQLSCGDLGDIIFSTTPPTPTTTSLQERMRITREGKIISQMWKVTQVFSLDRTPRNPIPPDTPIVSQPFNTGGGTLLIFASGSGEPTATTGGTSDIVIGFDIFLDNVSNPVLGGARGCANLGEHHKTFTTNALVVLGTPQQQHTLILKTSKTTTITSNDFFNVTILELPF